MADKYADMIKKAREFGVTDDEILEDFSVNQEFMTQHGEKIKGFQARVKTDDERKNLSKDILDVLAEGGADSPGYGSMIKSGALDAFEGFGAGVANSAVGLYDMASKGTKKAMGVNLPPVPAVLREAGTTPPDASGMFKLGKGGEQTAEFFLPAGGITKISKGANTLMGGKKLGAAAEALTRIAAEGVGGGVIAGAQSHGDEDTMKIAAAISAGVTAPFATVNAALRMIRPATVFAPKTFLTKLPDRFRGGRLDEMVEQAFQDGVTISHKGVMRSKQASAAATQVDDLIAQNPNMLIDLDILEKPLLGMKDIANRAGRTDLVNQIDARLAAVKSSHGAQPGVPAGTVTLPAQNPAASLTPAGVGKTVNTPAIPPVPAKITLAEAQEIKRFTQDLANNQYAKLFENAGPGRIDELEAEGFMKAIEDLIPEARSLNRLEQNRATLRTAIERYLTDNRDLVTPQLAFYATLGSMSFGAPGFVGAIMIDMLKNPRVRSALALAANRGSIQTVGGTLGKIGASAGTSLFGNPPQPPGQ